MAPHNTTPEGFRTVAYLATKARLDAARSRTGKTSRQVTCTPPNVKCGGRCIPPNWDCRIKGKGPDPHLRAVKTDPLGGLANIQRGATRIAKGVAKGNISEVEGGKRAIIRGVVKATPGDLQRKQRLQATLENRTRLIGTGLAVVTLGLGSHALLMKSNPFGYREGVGANINNAVRLGMSRILDATPVVGANRARVRRQVGAAIGAQLERQANPVSSVLTNQLARTQPSQADTAGASNLAKAIADVDKKFAGAEVRFGPGLSAFDRWDREHQNAFFNTTKIETGVGLKEGQKGNVFARPATNEFLARQFNLSGDDVLTTASIKDAIELQLTRYKSSLLDLAQQQGFNVKIKGANRIFDGADRRRFIQGLVQTTLPKGKSNDLVRSKLTQHLEDTLNFTPKGRTDKLYSDTYKGFNDFYTDQAEVISKNVGAGMTKQMRSTGAEQVILDGRTARAQYLLQFKERGAGKQIQGEAHAELVLRDYFATQVSKAPRQMYTITERLAAAAASELEGRPVSARDAFNVLEREGFTGAVPAVAARPARPARGAQAQVGDLARSLREAAQRRGETMSLEASYRAARAEIARRQRGDSTEHDLPPRVRAYLATRADFKEGGRLGKPCGASHIPKAHECRKGAGGAPAKTTPESGATSDRLRAAATGALVAGLAVGGAVAFRNRQSLAMGAIRGLSAEKVQAGLAKVPPRFQEPVRNLLGRTKTAVAGVLMVSKGSKLIDVDNANNMATFSLRNGDLVSVSSVGDALVMFRTHPNNTIDYGGGESAGRYVVDFTVDLMHKQTKQDRKQALGIARKTKTMFTKQMSYVPDNSFVTAEALGTDGLGNKRGSIYQKYGFQPIGEISTHLWGMKTKGEFRKMNQRQVNSLVAVLREQKRIDASKYLATRADFKEGGRVGKPCGASHIPKAHECRKGAGSAPAKETPESGTSTRRKAAAAALAVLAIGATAATGAYVIQDMKRVAKQPNMFAPSPSTRTIAKAAKKEFDTKKSGTAMGNYYTKKSGLKPGDVVYYRNEKDPAAHFGIYIGEGKDGKVRAVMANTNEKRAGFVDVMEIGTTKPDSNDAAHFMFPVLQKAPPLKGAKARTNEETVRRALRAAGTDYKFSLTRDNCEVLANSIAYDTPRSQQLERFKRLTRRVADSTIGARQRAGMTIRRARGQRKTTALSAQQILQRLSKDDNSFLTEEGRDIARNHYSQYFESGAKLDAAPMPPALISPDQLWDRIKDYDDSKKAIAMRDYLLVLRLALDTNAAA
jgi:hypothetical protein